MKGFSILVCFYNAAERIQPTLEHLSQLDVPAGWQAEVLLVDNASTDGTTEMARELWASIPVKAGIQLRFLHEAQPGSMHARKLGVSQAQFSHIIYCDDDNWLSPDYLTVLADLIEQHPDAAAFGGIGRAISSIPIPTFFQWVRVTYATGPQQAATGYRQGDYPWLYTAGLCIDRQAMSKSLSAIPLSITNGREGDKLTGADDNELCYKLSICGYKIYYSEALKFDHFMEPRRLNFAYYQRLLDGSAQSNALLIALLMNFKQDFAEHFRRRIHWKTGLLRRYKYAAKAKMLGRQKNVTEDEQLFREFTNSFYAARMLKYTQQNKDKILQYYQTIRQQVEQAGLLGTSGLS